VSVKTLQKFTPDAIKKAEDAIKKASEPNVAPDKK
jgi:hypothetical protein